jgi:hypothetical protein
MRVSDETIGPSCAGDGEIEVGGAASRGNLTKRSWQDAP